MGRPSNWNSPTDSVRLPKHAIPACLALARQLDDAKPVGDVKNNVQNPPGPFLLTSESTKGTFQLVVRPQSEPVSKVWAERLAEAEEMFGTLSTDEQWLMLGRMVEEWGQKVDA